MNFLREGNEWIVSEFFRLARSTTDLFNIVDSLTKKWPEYNVTEIAKHYKVSRPTVYKWLRQ